MPCISDKTYKRYEREVGLAMEAAAKESCTRAAHEEIEMVLAQMGDLLQQLWEHFLIQLYTDNHAVYSKKLVIWFYYNCRA